MPFDWVTPAAISHFKSVQSVKPLFPIKDEFGFEWWYAYFWKEVKGAGAPDADFQSLLDMIYEEPEVNLAGLGFRAKQDARNLAAKTVIDTGPALNAFNDGRKRRILKKLLDMGFRSMPSAAMHRNPNDTRDFFKFQIRYDNNGNGRIPMALGFRGEGRDPATVTQHQGAKNRVDLGMLGMDKTWHPFSEPAVGKHMYFRRSSGDNCLYSVTSVASDLEVSIGFPLIEDENIYNRREKPLEKWTLSDWQLLRNPPNGKKGLVVVKIRLMHDGRLLYGYALGSESYLYLLKVTGEAVHTQNFLGGDQCRERGVREIQMNDFLAAFRLRRIHFGGTRSHGLHAIVHATKYYVGGAAWADQVTDKQIADFHFDGDTRAAGVFRNLIDKEILDPKALLGEVIAPNPKKTIYEIVDWDVEHHVFSADARNPEIVFLPV